jgi:hypothetical protein
MFRNWPVPVNRLKAKSHLEFLRVPAMSAGVYVLLAGARDPQQPNHQDEIYYVVWGWSIASSMQKRSWSCWWYSRRRRGARAYGGAYPLKNRKGWGSLN